MPQTTTPIDDRADDDALFAAHAAAYDELRRRDPKLMRAIADEDQAWERSDLARPPEAG